MLFMLPDQTRSSQQGSKARSPRPVLRWQKAAWDACSCFLALMLSPFLTIHFPSLVKFVSKRLDIESLSFAEIEMRCQHHLHLTPGWVLMS